MPKAITKRNKMICHTDSPRLADGSIPILPVIIEASSDKISPNMLFVTIVSNCNCQSHCKARISHQWGSGSSLSFSPEFSRFGRKMKRTVTQICFRGKPVLDSEQAALRHCQHTCVRVQHQGILRLLPWLYSSKGSMPENSLIGSTH